MSNWKNWPPIGDRNKVNFVLGNVETYGTFRYPNLRDGSDFILASDYSGEHQHPEFQVLSFLLTQRSSVFGAWEAARLSVRSKQLSDGRRMAFKKLTDARRINALMEFLAASTLLNGLLVCVAVEKSHSFGNRLQLAPLRHKWSCETLEKLLRICILGSGFVDGLRGEGQKLFWITDDDAIVATDNARADAARLMGSLLHAYPDERLALKLRIGSRFNDGLRAEDLLAIPDLAAGAFSDFLMQLGKSNLSTTEIGPGPELLLKTKSTLINIWRGDNSRPLKHLDVVVRAAQDGKDTFSFLQPYSRIPGPDELVPAIPPLNEKWTRALTNWLNRRNTG